MHFCNLTSRACVVKSEVVQVYLLDSGRGLFHAPQMQEGRRSFRAITGNRRSLPLLFACVATLPADFSLQCLTSQKVCLLASKELCVRRILHQRAVLQPRFTFRARFGPGQLWLGLRQWHKPTAAQISMATGRQSPHMALLVADCFFGRA